MDVTKENFGYVSTGLQELNTVEKIFLPKMFEMKLNAEIDEQGDAE